MNIILRRDPVLIYINRSMWTLSYNDKDNAEILSPWGVSGCANNLGRPNDCANCFVLTKRHVICVICVYSDIKMNIRVGNKWCISLWTENYLILCFAALTWPSSWEPMICIPEDLELQNTMLWSACTGYVEDTQWCRTLPPHNMYIWWRHQMEMFSALLALCAGNSPVIGEFPPQRPVSWSFDAFFDLRLNKHSSKQLWGW